MEERKGEKHTIIMIDVLLPFRRTHTYVDAAALKTRSFAKTGWGHRQES